MIAEYDDNNEKLVTQVLDKAITQIFIRCHLGQADWDINASLREAILASVYLKTLSDVCKKYDDTFDIAESSSIVIDKKYKYLYKLTNNR
jgi:hypothetical protein